MHYGRKFKEDSFIHSLTLWKCFCIVFISSFLCYSNTINSEFVYDDTRCILRNQDLLPSTPWINIFYDDFWGTPLSHSGSHKSYRPLCILSFRINDMFGELNPMGYHFVNIIFHSIVSCLFVYFCYKLYHEEWLALVGGLMFAFHPIHTEAVAGVVGRADIGAAMFFLCSLIFYQNATANLAHVSYLGILCSLLSAKCSMYTKEQGFTVFGVLVAYELLFVSKCNLAYPKQILKTLHSSKGTYRILITITFSIFALYTRFLIMGNALPEFSPADNPAANESNTLTRMLTFLYLPFCNFWLLVYPSNLSYDYSMATIPLVENVFSIETFLSILLYASLILSSYFYLHCSRNNFDQEIMHTHSQTLTKTSSQNVKLNYKILNKDKVNNQNKEMNDNKNSFIMQTQNHMILAMAILILPFLPATNLFFYVGFIIAERILYIPSIGFCLLIINGINLLIKHYKEKQRQIIVIVAIILTMFAVKTYDRNFVWKDEESLYRSGLATSPAKSYGNLANILINQNKLKEAEQAYRTALKFRFNMADTHYNLGILLQNQERYEEAIMCYKDAIKYRPRLAAAHLNLGVTLMTIKKLEEALEVLNNSSEISDHGLKDPHIHARSLTSIRYTMGKVLYDLERYEEAIEVFLDAIKRMPDFYEAHSIYNMLGQCYTALKKAMHAEPWYIRALQEKPDHVPALLTCARHYHETNEEGDWERAEEYLKKALILKPKKTEVYLMYAGYLEDRNKLKAAISMLMKASKFDSKNIKVLTYISSIYRNLNNYAEAVKYQLVALQVNPKETATLMNLGAMYHVTGQLKKAQETYSDALRLEPNNRILLGNIQRLKKAIAKASV